MIKSFLNKLKFKKQKLFYFFRNLFFFDNYKYDILLIYPRSKEDRVILTPHSLLSLCRPLIENNYRVKIIDQRIEKKCFVSINRILKKGVICVGLTFYTGSQIKYACELIDYIKETYPSVKIIVGGIHATILPRQTLEYKNIDIVVIGEGEKTFLDLIRALEIKNNLNSIKGLIFKENGKIIQTLKQESVDINRYYSTPLFLIKNYYYHYYYSYPYIGSIITSRGCPGGCSYCVLSFLGQKWKSIRPDLMIKQLKELLKIGIRNVYFIDDNFFVDFKRVEHILDLITNEKLIFRWWAECRIDYILKMDEGFLKKLKMSNLNSLYLGGESGSDRILKMVNKNIDVAMIKKVNIRLKNFGIIPEFTFMTGFPTETEEEFRETLNLIEQLRIDNNSAVFWRVNKYTPYPGTQLFDLAVKEGFTPPKNLKEWSKVDWYRINYQINYQKQLL